MTGLRGRIANWLGNWRVARNMRRTMLSRLPFPVLASDVRDVIYANWVVRIKDIRAMIPPSLTVVEREGCTILTILTYRHGHFGPRLLGPLRRLLPSPLQSNWRLYLEPDRPGEPHVVLFLRNVFDNALHTLGTRLFSDILPSHQAERFVHTCDGRRYFTEISGRGSAPAIRLETALGEKHLLVEFTRFFASWDAAVAFLCLQDAAIAEIEDIERLAYGEIDLPIDVATVAPLDVIAFEAGALLQDMGAVGKPLCFCVPSVPFLALSERILPELDGVS